jgi:hypothetical protein
LQAKKLHGNPFLLPGRFRIPGVSRTSAVCVNYLKYAILPLADIAEEHVARKDIVREKEIPVHGGIK